MEVMNRLRGVIYLVFETPKPPKLVNRTAGGGFLPSVAAQMKTLPPKARYEAGISSRQPYKRTETIHTVGKWP